MTAQNTAQEGRARLSFDPEDDEPENSPEATHRKIHEISDKAGFIARAPRRVPAKDVVPAITAPDVDEERPRRRRAKTGRTYPFNTKIRPETYDKICSLADEATEKE